jgi:hypothetical protein
VTQRRIRIRTGLLAVPLLAFVAAFLQPVPAAAYQHFSQDTAGAGVTPSHWTSIPISVLVDNGPTDISAEIVSATNTWNAVTTAKNVWGTPTKAVDGSSNPVNFTGANMGTAWGKLTGDGKQEVIFDEDGTALTALGLAPASVNGYGPSRQRIVGGVAVIDDMYLIINGTRTNFDRQATQIHELGHTLGLAHSSVGFYLNKPAALSPVTSNDVPTMHPYSVGGGSQRRTLEADDVASLSELYPETSFGTTFGTIQGTVTRCESGDPVLGANVRIINASNPAIQLTRVTGFDGNDAGKYVIHGVPAGNYIVLVEPLSGDADYLNRLAMYTRVDTDFTQEYHNETKESNCGEDGDPNAKEDVAVGAASTKTANFKVNPVELAFVIDTTGSMGPEIGAVRDGLQTFITAVEANATATGKPFPNTAVVTFKDGVSIDIVSRKPAELRTVVGGLSASGGNDCPEAANAALMAAGRLLARGGRAVLATDADSRPDGPSRESVENLYRGKGVRLSTILSGVCTGGSEVSGAKSATGARSADAQNQGQGQGQSSNGEVLTPVDALGSESSITTFTELSSFTGGVFSYQPDVKGGTADALTEFSNTVANVAISSVTPAVGLVNPSKLPKGTTLDVELTGSNTNFRTGSVLSVAGSGVSVVSTTVASPTKLFARLATAGGAALGFRDVAVTTDLGGGITETAKGIGAVDVVAAPTDPTILGVIPSSATVGETVDVTIAGGLTHFANGTSAAAFGPGVTVNKLSVTSPTSAVANLTIAPNAAVGFRSVKVTTGSEIADENVTGPLLVLAETPPIPEVVSASPSFGRQGQTVDVTLTGANTTFGPTSAVSVSGIGVQVVSTTVNSPTKIVARLQLAGDAPLGFRDVVVATGGEVAALLNGFQVLAITDLGRSDPGYALIGGDGGLFAFHGGFAGTAGVTAPSGKELNGVIVGGAGTPTGKGYWLAGLDGGVFAFGDAPFLKSMAGKKLNQPIIAMAATPTGKGYWLVAVDGGVFAFGDARFFGSAATKKLNQPISGIAPTPTGLGYWLVGSDGGVFAYGDAKYKGGANKLKLREPVIGIISSPTGLGYVLAAADGGTFAYGDGKFKGSAAKLKLKGPIVGILPGPLGVGYWLVGSDGGVFAYGAPFHGSVAGKQLNQPIIGILLL